MLGLTLVLLFLFSKTLANTKVNQSLNNGWIPITHADVVNQKRNGVLKRNYDVSWSQAIKYLDVITENALKIVNPQPGASKEIFYYSPRDHHSIDNTPVYRKNKDKTLKQLHGNELYKNIPDHQNYDRLNKTENEIETTNEHQRQSKQVEFFNLFEIETTSTEKHINVTKYEVTEPSNIEETVQEIDTNSRGYIYRPPVVMPFRPVRNDITKKLYKNLRKYNIRSNDMLKNYAASKSKINHDSMFNMYRHHLEPVVPVPFRYNSLNHLPVNPLLAVFLSNYGYYTKESYGPQNNYRNLYGYTASNNIHNNYPFGSYKIFSDTDSSH